MASADRLITRIRGFKHDVEEHHAMIEAWRVETKRILENNEMPFNEYVASWDSKYTEGIDYGHMTNLYRQPWGYRINYKFPNGHKRIVLTGPLNPCSPQTPWALYPPINLKNVSSKPYLTDEMLVIELARVLNLPPLSTSDSPTPDMEKSS